MVNQDKNIVEMCKRQKPNYISRIFPTKQLQEKKTSKLRKQFPFQHSVGLNPNIAVDFCQDLYLSCYADI